MKVFSMHTQEPAGAATVKKQRDESSAHPAFAMAPFEGAPGLDPETAAKLVLPQCTVGNLCSIHSHKSTYFPFSSQTELMSLSCNVL
jgi:hypothetical protein